MYPSVPRAIRFCCAAIRFFVWWTRADPPRRHKNHPRFPGRNPSHEKIFRPGAGRLSASSFSSEDPSVGLSVAHMKKLRRLVVGISEAFCARNWEFRRSFPVEGRESITARQTRGISSRLALCRQIFLIPQNIRDLRPPVSVGVSMRRLNEFNSGLSQHIVPRLFPALPVAVRIY